MSVTIPVLGSVSFSMKRLKAAGIGKAADRVPEFMKLEPLPPHNQVFDVPDSALDSVYAEL